MDQNAFEFMFANDDHEKAAKGNPGPAWSKQNKHETDRILQFDKDPQLGKEFNAIKKGRQKADAARGDVSMIRTLALICISLAACSACTSGRLIPVPAYSPRLPLLCAQASLFSPSIGGYKKGREANVELNCSAPALGPVACTGLVAHGAVEDEWLDEPVRGAFSVG